VSKETGRDTRRDRYRDRRDEKEGYEERERCEGRQVKGQKRREGRLWRQGEMRGETGKGTEETRRKVMKAGRDARRDR
jgi:hypothetical protein